MTYTELMMRPVQEDPETLPDGFAVCDMKTARTHRQGIMWGDGPPSFTAHRRCWVSTRGYLSGATRVLYAIPTS